MADLRLNGISKIYPENIRGVASLTFEVSDGEFVVLVGPSGCGKTTVLRMIAGLERVTSGEIYIDGILVNDVPAKERDIAMVFQNYALYPHMTVYENMSFSLKMRRVPKAEIDHRVRQAADILALSSLLDRRPKALSGGQRQRVALGRAIVRQPKLFLFDEPLSNLDAKLRVAMRAELIKLHKRLHATTIYVTHDQVEAMSLGSRLIVLKDGIVQQMGAPLEVYDRPANQFVAAFIGSPAMNFFNCSVVQHETRLLLSGDGFEVRLPSHIAASLTASPVAPRKVVLGMRPEDIFERRVNYDADETNTVMARVDFLESLGSEVLATCSIGGQEMVVRLNPKTSATAEDKIKLVFDMERAKLFDPTTGNKLY